MSISDNYTPLKELGNGVTTEFSDNWQILSEQFIRVFLEDALTGDQTPVDQGGAADEYQLTFNDSGFVVTFNTAPTSDNYVVISREVSQDQTVPYKTSKGFQGGVTEGSFDKLTAMVQDTSEEIGRTLRFPVGVSFSGVLPIPENGKTIKWTPEEDGRLINSTFDPDKQVELSQGFAESAEASADSAADSAAAAAASAQQVEDAKLIWRGAWGSATGYVINDAVEFGGSSYIAIQANTNSQPDTNPADWDLLALKGTDGAGTGTVTSVGSGEGLTGGPITGAGSLALDINGLTEDLTPDTAADFVATYDASGLAHKKVLIDNLISGGGGGGGLIDVQVFTTSGTWNKPANTQSVEVTVVGGGGGGGSAANTGGGGSGSTGGASQFGTHCSATGGAGGRSPSAVWTTGANGGTGSNGDINITGQAGGLSVYGSGVTQGHSGAGGSSILGGGGRSAVSTSGGRAGQNGGAYGAGGSGGSGNGGTNGNGTGGAGGGAAIKYITTGLGSTETVTVGAGGSRGSTIPSEFNGGTGAAGIVIVKSYS